MPFDPADRTYHVSDERLRAFRALPVEDRLRWVEELAAFLRIAKASRPQKPKRAWANWLHDHAPTRHCWASAPSARTWSIAARHLAKKLV